MHMPPQIHRTFSKDLHVGIMPPPIEPLRPSETWSPPSSVQGNLRQRKIYIGLGNDLGTVDIPFFRSTGGNLAWGYTKTRAGRLMMRGSWNVALYGELDKIYNELRYVPDYPPEVPPTPPAGEEAESQTPPQEPNNKRRRTEDGEEAGSNASANVNATELALRTRPPKRSKAFLVFKNRLSGLWGQTTPMEELLNDRGIKTLLFAGINTDQ